MSILYRLFTIVIINLVKKRLYIYHCAGKRKGCHSHPPKPLPETQLYVLWVFRRKPRTLKGYSVALSLPFYLKFWMYTRLGVLDSHSKFQVSISSGTGVIDWSHLLKIQCNTRTTRVRHARA